MKLRTLLVAIRRKIVLPYLDLWVDLGLVSIKTELWAYHDHVDVFVYVRLAVRVWGGRWGFDVRLYRPGHAR